MRRRSNDETPRTNDAGATRLRLQWAAIGAAIAVVLGSGAITSVDALRSNGERAVYVATTPCRLLDTRSSAPIGPADTLTITARGAQGACSAAQLPNDASALVLNVTAESATATTFLTFWPDGARPNSSSLNPAPGQPPVPNAVTTLLSPTGTFQLFNNAGTVHVLIDVVGYYADHNHDDRYYTEAEINSQLLTAVVSSAGTLVRGRAVVGAQSPSPGRYLVTFDRDVSGCVFTVSPGATGSIGASDDVVASVAGASADSDSVFVRTEHLLTGSDEPASFHLQVIC